MYLKSTSKYVLFIAMLIGINSLSAQDYTPLLNDLKEGIKNIDEDRVVNKKGEDIMYNTSYKYNDFSVLYLKEKKTGKKSILLMGDEPKITREKIIQDLQQKTSWTFKKIKGPSSKKTYYALIEKGKTRGFAETFSESNFCFIILTHFPYLEVQEGITIAIDALLNDKVKTYKTKKEGKQSNDLNIPAPALKRAFLSNKFNNEFIFLEYDMKHYMWDYVCDNDKLFVVPDGCSLVKSLPQVKAKNGYLYRVHQIKKGNVVFGIEVWNIATLGVAKIGTLPKTTKSKKTPQNVQLIQDYINHINKTTETINLVKEFIQEGFDKYYSRKVKINIARKGVIEVLDELKKVRSTLNEAKETPETKACAAMDREVNRHLSHLNLVTQKAIALKKKLKEYEKSDWDEDVKDEVKEAFNSLNLQSSILTDLLKGLMKGYPLCK